MKCYIVKDLLPNYIDGLTCEEVNMEIKKHLEECKGCRTIYKQMSLPVSRESIPEDENIDFLKKLKGKIRERYAAVIFLTCAVLAVIFFFLHHYDIPLSFDPEVMRTEIYKATTVTNNGFTQWRALDDLDFEETKKFLEEQRGSIDMIQLVLKGAACDDFHTCSRTVEREGGPVRVTYYCLTEKLWNRLFRDRNYKMSGKTSGDIYSEDINSLEYYRPQKREIYYLPIRNIEKLDKLSDEEFDAQKEHAELVWSGVI